MPPSDLITAIDHMTHVKESQLINRANNEIIPSPKTCLVVDPLTLHTHLCVHKPRKIVVGGI